MSMTLQIDLDPRVVEQAEAEARRRATTVSAIVGQQIQIMARNWQDSQGRRTPVTDALRGVLPLVSEQEVEALLAQELARKHG